MKKTTAFKVLTFFIAVLLATSGSIWYFYSDYDIVTVICTKKAIYDYEKSNNPESLAKIIGYSYATNDFEKMNKYGYQFFFPEYESDKEVLTTAFNDFWRNADDSLTAENVKTMYNLALWFYVYSCVLDYKTLEVKNYADVESEINEIYLECFELLDGSDNMSAEAMSVMQLCIDREDFPKDFLGILNLFSMNKSKEETFLIYRIAFDLAYELESYPESHFWNSIMSNSVRSNIVLKESNDVKNPAGKGILAKDYSKEELEKIMDSFTESDNNGYDEITNYFSVFPEELTNGFHYSFHYYTEDYILSFYGSPVYGMTISEIDTGRMLYGKTKVVSNDLGLEW